MLPASAGGITFMPIHHLDPFIDKMNQKSTIVQNVVSVPEALTLDLGVFSSLITTFVVKVL